MSKNKVIGLAIGLGVGGYVAGRLALTFLGKAEETAPEPAFNSTDDHSGMSHHPDFRAFMSPAYDIMGNN